MHGGTQVSLDQGVVLAFLQLRSDYKTAKLGSTSMLR
jgi:hypothetical protein